MSEKKIERIAIVGTGAMGSGIGLEFARFGYEVNLYDLNDEILKRTMQIVQENIDLMVETELIPKNKAKEVLARLHPTANLATALKDVDHVTEAVPENPKIKADMFEKMDALAPAYVSLATNASGIRAAVCASKVKNHPERILTTHYWQPAQYIPLVEVIGWEKGDPKQLDRVAALLRTCRKKVVVQPKEMPTEPAGWGNQLQWVVGVKARELIDQHGVTPYIVDDLIKFGFGRRMGYTAAYIRSDMLGLDWTYNNAKARGVEPWGPIKERVERGELGMKSGKGFYDWSGGKAQKFLREFNIEMIKMMKKDMERGDI